MISNVCMSVYVEERGKGREGASFSEIERYFVHCKNFSRLYVEELATGCQAACHEYEVALQL